jgi:anionic cell wall polymer biosynthesis LytR-Cps2A-Psr (LCP) family protein
MLIMAMVACSPEPTGVPGPILSPTPIVVNITVPTQSAAQQATSSPLTATVVLRPRQIIINTGRIDPPPTIPITVSPQPVGPRYTQLTQVPVTATTGLSPTAEFTDTAVPAPMTEIGLPAGTINIALLGVDSRPDKGFANTDVIVIASINPEAPAVTMLSIPRDTLVYIPGKRSAKVNTAFALGGPELFKQTIKYNFGINIDYYAMVNFTGVVDAVDTLGGVDIVATCPLYQVFPKDPYYMGDDRTPLTVTQVYTNYFTKEVWTPGMAVPTTTIDIKHPGVYEFDGLQALAYVRARYGVPGGDVDRGRREQRFLRALLSKARQLKAITRIPQLLAQFADDLQTDLKLENILYFAGMADRFSDAVIRSRYIDSTGLTAITFPEIGSVLIPDRAKLHDYIQQSLFVALNQRPNEGIPIEVWNGTNNRDFGIVAADRLAELGFTITDVRPAEQPVARTAIIDYSTTRKGSAVPLLQRTFRIADDRIMAQPAPDGPRYRIIVGPDFDPCYYDNGDHTPIQLPVSTQP